MRILVVTLAAAVGASFAGLAAAFAPAASATPESIEVGYSPETVFEDELVAGHVKWTTDGSHWMILTFVKGSCAARPDENGHEYGGVSVSEFPGTWTETRTFTPEEGGTYSVCGYLDESESAVPVATSFEPFEVRVPKGSVAVEVSPASVEGAPVTIRVHGETERSRRLWVVVGSPSCSFGEWGTTLVNGETVTGSFARSYTYTPTQPGYYCACAFLDDESTHPPNAEASASFVSASRAASETAEQLARRVVAEELAKQERETRERAEAEAAAHAAAASSAKARARSTPVALLTVHPLGRPGHSLRDPGYTDLDISTSPYAFVTVKLTHRGWATHRLEWGSASKGLAETLPWSCAAPGAAYTYVVSARTNVGPALTARGRFTLGSAGHCDALRGTSRAVERKAAAEERARLARLSSGCGAAGGKLETYAEAGGRVTSCRSTAGPFLPLAP
jgi:hypothetical protein